MEWFIWLCFGHLFGDYAFQNVWMGTNKKDLELACLMHCTIYAFVVSTFLWLGGIPWSFLLFSLLFASHWIFDYTYVINKWIRLIDSRSWDTNLPRKRGTYKQAPSIENIEWSHAMTTKQIVHTIFGAIIYVVLDNTAHIFSMFLIVKWLT